MFLASLPLWFAGLFMFAIGLFAIFAVALHEEETTPRFKTISDGGAILLGFGFVFASAVPLFIAAKVMS